MNITENLSDLSLNYFSLLRKLSSKFDLTLSQALLLLYVPFDGISVSNLSDKLGIDISTMTRNIQRIEKQGLIKRSKNLNDKRAPLADGYNGFFSDVHSDLGRNYYLDFRVDL